jgi:hypothetical protein
MGYRSLILLKHANSNGKTTSQIILLNFLEGMYRLERRAYTCLYHTKDVTAKESKKVDQMPGMKHLSIHAWIRARYCTSWVDDNFYIQTDTYGT